MINAYDIAYTLGLAATAPYWLVKPAARKKILHAFRNRMGTVPATESQNPAILIHAVSLGEINATPALVKLLQQARPNLHIIISTTTETGHDRGQQLYGQSPSVTLIRFPIDFTNAIIRLLDALRPSLVVLMELELWPNFLLQCHKRKIPVALINGRMTPPAFHRYKLIKPITRAMLDRLSKICVQDEPYADLFQKLGASPDKIHVTGTMKFDTAQIQDKIPGDTELAETLGLTAPGTPIWVCGSTGPGEETILLSVYRTLLNQFPKLRLVLVPRKPERFNEVATLIEQAGYALLRRSAPVASALVKSPVILGDTMGELKKFYSLADVVFVGRTLLDLGSRQHGSDMIEPAALAKPIFIGPWTNNFAEPMRKFREANAIEEARDAFSLEQKLRDYLQDPASAIAMGKRAQQVVHENQGATARHAQILLQYL